MQLFSSKWLSEISLVSLQYKLSASVPIVWQCPQRYQVIFPFLLSELPPVISSSTSLSERNSVLGGHVRSKSRVLNFLVGNIGRNLILLLYLFLLMMYYTEFGLVWEAILSRTRFETGTLHRRVFSSYTFPESKTTRYVILTF